MEKREQTLWKNYKKHRNIDNRNNLIEYYTDMAKKFAVNFHKSYGKSTVDEEDFISWGLIGLITAVENYDNNKSTQFSTYAYSRIRGTILDNMSNLDALPRSMSKKLTMLYEKRNEFIMANGREPHNDELAKAMGISVKSLNDVLTIERDIVQCRSNTDTIEILGDIKSNIDPTETKELLFSALDKLDDKDYRIFKLIYIEHKTLQEVGKILRRSGACISQRNAFILDTIKEVCGA